MLRNLQVDEFRSVRIQAPQRAGFIHSHETRITDNISGHDRR
jgi:hypothetical protein